MRQRSPQKVTKLNHSLLHKLDLYLLAASAMAGTLASAPQAEAEVVYAPAHRTILPRSVFNLDLNHDGTIDFVIANGFGPSGTSGGIGVYAPGCNRFCSVTGVESAGGFPPYAACLGAGEVVPDYSFFASGVLFAAGSRTVGFWMGQTNHYLGLKFQKDGQTHYGWARLSVGYARESTEPRINVLVNGYAYETVPDKAIITGLPVEADFGDSPTNPAPAQPVSLGMLALGSQSQPLSPRK